MLLLFWDEQVYLSYSLPVSLWLCSTKHLVKEVKKRKKNIDHTTGESMYS